MVERGDAKVFPPQKEVGMGGKSVSRAKGREGGGAKKSLFIQSFVQTQF